MCVDVVPVGVLGGGGGGLVPNRTTCVRDGKNRSRSYNAYVLHIDNTLPPTPLIAPLPPTNNTSYLTELPSKTIMQNDSPS